METLAMTVVVTPSGHDIYVEGEHVNVMSSAGPLGSSYIPSEELQMETLAMTVVVSPSGHNI